MEHASHAGALIQDLAIIMVVAGLVTVLFHKLKQPVVLGYILAGFLVGPHTPSLPTIQDTRVIEQLAEIGVVLLMFSLGMHFSLRKLARVGPTALVAALCEFAVMGWLGWQIGRWFGWSTMDGIFLGGVLAISSTTIIVKALAELGRTKERFAELIFGILIVEDILGIALIALLTTVATTGSLGAGEIATTLGGLAVFLTVAIVAGLLAVPWLLRLIARYKSGEMLLIAALAICFGMALIAAQLGYSVALGAFIAGALVAEAREAGRINDLIEPVRDMFSAVFFVAIGMLIDPAMLVEHAWPIAAVTAAVVLGKVLSISAGSFLAGNDPRTALRVGMGMAQIGEFSFIIAQLGLTLKVTSPFLYPVAVAVSAITTLLTPYLIRASDPTVALIERHAPRSLSAFVGLYPRWLAQVRGTSGDARQQAARKFLMRLVLQVSLDVVLVAGLMIAAALMARRDIPFLDHLPEWAGGKRSALWAGAVALSLPILVHAFLKLRALAYLLAELGVANLASREQMPRLRAIAATMILAVGTTAAVLGLLALGLAILPPWPVLAALVTALALTVALLWRRFGQMYARAQTSLRETFARPVETGAHERPLATALHGARLDTVAIAPGSIAAGRLIREIGLRSRTGATVVGVERAGINVVNPGPDEEIQAGDNVLLIGTAEHVAAARALLSPGSTKPEP